MSRFINNMLSMGIFVTIDDFLEALYSVPKQEWRYIENHLIPDSILLDLMAMKLTWRNLWRSTRARDFRKASRAQQAKAREVLGPILPRDILDFILCPYLHYE